MPTSTYWAAGRSGCGSDGIDRVMQNQGSGGLVDILGDKSPLLSALGIGNGSGSGSDPSSALFGSLPSGSDSSSRSSSSGNGMSPFGGLASLRGAGADTDVKSWRRRKKRGGRRRDSGGMDGLAKSVLKNLAKRIDDEQTQRN